MDPDDIHEYWVNYVIEIVNYVTNIKCFNPLPFTISGIHIKNLERKLVKLVLRIYIT